MARFAVFISHDSKDYEVSERLHNVLWKMKMLPYMYELYPQYRKSIPEGIRYVIRNCSVCLAFLTSFGVESPWVHQELGLAYGYNRIIIPIMERGIEFKRKGFVEFYDHIDYDPHNFDGLACHVIYALREEAFGHEESACLILRCPDGHLSDGYVLPDTGQVNEQIRVKQPFTYPCRQCNTQIEVSPWTFEEL